MSYQKNNWQDLPSTATPINATRLNNMENGIEEAVNVKGSITSSTGISSTSGSTAEFVTACTLTLSKGVYVVLGFSEANSSSANALTAKFNITNATKVSGGDISRGTMINGGGLNFWAIFSIASSTGTIELQNYVDSSYNISSTMSAIKLSAD